MNRRRKLLLVLLCVCFVLASVLPLGFALRYYDHDCPVRECHLCLEFAQLVRAAEAFRLGVAAVGAIVIRSIAAALPLCFAVPLVQSAETPVSLKIQMNN